MKLYEHFESISKLQENIDPSRGTSNNPTPVVRRPSLKSTVNNCQMNFMSYRMIIGKVIMTERAHLFMVDVQLFNK